MGSRITSSSEENENYKKACEAVAQDWRDLAHRIYADDEYASHVTDDQKRDYFIAGLVEADAIAKGNITSFTIWQRVNEKLTGECVGFLPKKKGQ